MYSCKKHFGGLLLILVSLLLTIGCAPPSYRAHPELDTRSKNIKTSGLLPPDIKIYEFTAGGVHELRDDWCNIGKDNVMRAFLENLNGKSIEIKTITIDKDIEEEIEDIQALYRAVSTSINMHTYGPFLFPEKQKNFDYSIGPLDKVLKKVGADAIVFIHGTDEISTSGRKALIAIGFITGIIPRSGITTLNVSIVDSSGAILWHSIKGNEGGHDLREHSSSKRIVESVLADFPRFKN